MAFGFELARALGAEGGEVAAVEVYAALVGEHLHDGFAECGFAGTGFADDAEGFALADGEADVFDGVEGFEGFAEEVVFEGEVDVDAVGADELGRVAFYGVFHAFGDGVDELCGVGVGGVGENLFDFAALYDFAVFHDADGFGVVFGESEVVGDEDNRHAHLFLEVVQEVEDFCLNGYVKGGGGFVGDEQGGVVEQRHGDHDALELAT